MDKESELEGKYQRLATEYSKVRSQATVLKKALLEEQSKNAEINETLKSFEQTVRKRDQEMESLIFRNDQLTKRIVVLQQDLQCNNNSKKGKNKLIEVPHNIDISILNEELQKKILENAELFNSISDKDRELLEYREKISSLEEMVSKFQTELENKEKTHSELIEKYKKDIKGLEKLVTDLKQSNNQNKANEVESENIKHWKAESERWKTECELLRSKPNSNVELTTFYESQLSKLLEENMLLKSETKTVWAENLSLNTRLENSVLELNKLKYQMESGHEELATANTNYRSQLDALTEHLAAQNEKITKQCDEIQILKHKLLLKK